MLFSLFVCLFVCNGRANQLDDNNVFGGVDDGGGGRTPASLLYCT